MFNKIIKVQNKNDVRYGTTTIKFEKTYSQIMGLLRKHECEQIFCTKDNEGFDQIGFTIELKPYLIVVPKVYVKDWYDDRIGIRIVYYLIDIILNLTKERIIDPDTLLLGSRLVHDESGQMRTVTEYILPKIEKEYLLPTGIKREESE